MSAPWLPGRDFYAHCTRSHFDSDHVPPAHGCKCGVYAHPNVVDARMWLRHDHRNERTSDRHPFFPVFVLGRVTLFHAVEYPGDVSALQFSLGMCGKVGSAGVELRANRARIKELWIYPDADLPRHTVTAAHLLLSMRWERWDVPVTVGEPDYTAAQWAGKQFPNYMYEQVGLFSPAAMTGDRA
jgi:hypothetical protein